LRKGGKGKQGWFRSVFKTVVMGILVLMNISFRNIPHSNLEANRYQVQDWCQGYFGFNDY
jgi:hypothetical protein